MNVMTDCSLKTPHEFSLVSGVWFRLYLSLFCSIPDQNLLCWRWSLCEILHYCV